MSVTIDGLKEKQHKNREISSAKTNTNTLKSLSHLIQSMDDDGLRSNDDVPNYNLKISSQISHESCYKEESELMFEFEGEHYYRVYIVKLALKQFIAFC